MVPAPARQGHSDSFPLTPVQKRPGRPPAEVLVWKPFALDSCDFSNYLPLEVQT